ncbi:MAG: serine/threonine-protein phosphatase [Planctomycetes bacterium]|nr:serine/threonine-protein phosphatase [Planctomycetota bacterium]
MTSEIRTEKSPVLIAGRPGLATLLFASDGLDLPQTICTRMAGQKWQWRKIGLAAFLDFDETKDLPTAILLDAGHVAPSEWKHLEEKIHAFGRKNIPVILLNWPIMMELPGFRLAFKVRSAYIEEIWARIESAMQFSTVLTENPPATEQQRQMQEQLKMAGTVQRNFLPQTLPDVDGVRFACIYHPAEWVSGDIYDIVRLDEKHVGMYLIDAVGHSIPAALLTMFLKHSAVLRETRNKQPVIFSPQHVLENLNQQMLAQQLKGCLFATCCYGLLDTQKKSFTFARAGHPYPILLRRGCQPVLLESRGGLLGVFEEMDLEEQTVAVQPGDKILLYSDGVEPLIGETSGNGQFVFTDLFLSLCEMPVISMMEAIEHAAEGWKRTSAEIDDITLLGMEIL